MARINIDTKRLGDTQLRLDIDAALAKPLKSEFIDYLIDDLRPGINSITVSFDPNTDTWSSDVLNNTVRIKVNPNMVITNMAEDQGIFHELDHYTETNIRITNNAVSAFTQSGSKLWDAMAQKYGSARAAEIIKYGFQEFFVQVRTNQYIIATEPFVDGMLQVNKLGSFTGKSIVEIEKMLSLDSSLNFELNEMFVGFMEYFVSQKKYGSIPTVFSAYIASQSGKSLREDGSVDFWVDKDGNLGRTNPDSNYSEDFIDNYGRVTSGGVAGASFGAHLRAFADLIGLDGTPGIQGTFNRPGEGTQPGAPGAPPTGNTGNGGSGAEERQAEKAAAKAESAASERPDKPTDQKASQKAELDKAETKSQPILLDLDGDGVRIDEISRSTVFVDAGGEGLSHRSAWAAAGDGVLFYDPDGRNDITEKRQYVFTEWDPTATSDLAAVRAVFDSDGDGKLTALDAEFAKFKVMVTNADGSRSVKALAELGRAS